MSKIEKNDPDQPRGRLKKAKDLFPSRKDLRATGEVVKVTVDLDKATLDFFKKSSNDLGLKYQRMIREVLRSYSKRYG